MPSRTTPGEPVGRWSPMVTPAKGTISPDNRPDGGWRAPAFAVLLILFNVALAVSFRDMQGFAPALALMGLAVAVIFTGARSMAVIAAIILTLLVLLVAANAAHEAAYGRALNMVTDAQILPRSLSALVGDFPVQAVSAMLGAAIACIVLFILARAMFRQALFLGAPMALTIVFGLAISGTVASVMTGGPLWRSDASALATAQARGLATYRRGLPSIRDALASDPLREKGGIAALEGANVHLLLIASYDGAALDEADFLPAFGTRLTDAGYAVASHMLAAPMAPMANGRATLIHESVLSGVTLESRDALPPLYRSNRTTLVDLFSEQGYRTVAIGPSARDPWSADGFFRFDSVLNFRALDYRGPSYGPLDIPDQVALKRIEDLVLERDGRSVFLVAPLVSSRWPWKTVPERLTDWTAIDRGQALGPMPRLDAPPSALPSLRYSLGSIVDYAENAVTGNDVLIVIGSPAQASGAAQDDGAAPVHVLSRDPAHLERFLAAGFVPGMVPATDASPGSLTDIPRLLAGQASALSTAPSGVSATE